MVKLQVLRRRFATTRSNNAEEIAALQTSISANAKLSAALTAQGINIKDVVAIQVGADGSIRVVVDDRGAVDVASRSTIQSQARDDTTSATIMASSANADMQTLDSATRANLVQLDSCDIADFENAEGMTDREA